MHSEMDMKVGFIGLGTMGASMAANLQKADHSLIVYDIRKEAAQQHIADGAVWVDSPREVAAASEVVFTSLPGPPEVEETALGPEGILAGMRPDTAFFDLSTNSRAVVQKIHAAFAEQGVHMLDSPVSGGPRGAASGKLALWVGGEESVYQRFKPVLDAIGDQARYVGSIGQATVAKLVHNCASYAINTALAETFTMGVKAGVDPLVLFEAVRQGATGRARTFDRLVDQFLPNRYDPPAFALRLAHKDVSLAVALGREVGVPMRLCNLTLEEMTEARNRGWDALDSRAPMMLQQERAGVKIEVDPGRISASLAADTSTASDPAKR
ncbi:MAG: NAD(P)-dependent oxidoreductase [SAR324 cluster bacterium]|nr:NAD(P)-dependent oxidoreductase [SAR324 cluster bacterium]MCZ6629409.1 NAD(P)-dependent oxidoreductase [SAR324 cluster bacterium]MCZ6728140.1 NAD(P)-dependent oxidoreductase [SAR324 cluster bacterium]MCZ6841958.1 NAD(P)-dependent oxidoreductase [SAR324 cluster bacterium]